MAFVAISSGERSCKHNKQTPMSPADKHIAMVGKARLCITEMKGRNLQRDMGEACLVARSEMVNKLVAQLVVVTHQLFRSDLHLLNALVIWLAYRQKHRKVLHR